MTSPENKTTIYGETKRNRPLYPIPCPFCKCTVFQFNDHGDKCYDKVSVECEMCLATGPMSLNEHLAIIMWNQAAKTPIQNAQEPNDFLSTLNICKTAENSLRRHGLTSAQKFLITPLSDIFVIHGVGKTSLRQIRLKMVELGVWGEAMSQAARKAWGT